MPPRLGYGTGMKNSDMLRDGNGIGVLRHKPVPLPILVLILIPLLFLRTREIKVSLQEVVPL